MPEQRAIVGNMTVYLGLLREHQIFRELPDHALKDLVVRSDLIGYAVNEAMLRQGDPSDSALLITQGDADVLVDAAHGQVPIGQLAAGAMVGEIGVFADMPRTASVRARTAVEALRLGRDDMLQIGGDNPAFLRAVIKQLGERILAFNRTVGVYTDAMAAIEQRSFEARLLDDLPLATPEFVNFAHTLRRVAERLGLRRPQGD
jgi:phosphoserine phosphatase RsbU/P